MNTAYLTSLKHTLPEVTATLERKGIEARHLEFGGEGKPMRPRGFGCDAKAGDRGMEMRTALRVSRDRCRELA